MRSVLLPAVVIGALVCAAAASATERFPPPDFDSGYKLPQATYPPPKDGLTRILEPTALLVVLALSAYLAFKRRSRRWIFVLMVTSLFYFGFWKQGCICSVGAIQNTTAALLVPGETMPWGAMIFFAAPLVAALAFGRIFCAAACPLGGLQDVVLVRPVKVPLWLEHALGLLAYAYLGAAVLFAATGSAFIICRYDPFIALLRFSGSLSMFALGASFLVIGLFVGRPYCRFLCPYGVLLRLFARASKWQVSITPDECIKCRLCEDACPFGAIREPNVDQLPVHRRAGMGMLVLLIALLPVLVLAGGWGVSRLSGPFSRVHSTVRLAERVWLEDTGKVEGTTDATTAFRNSTQAPQELYDEALALKRRFAWGGWALGGWIGAVVGLKLIGLSVRRRRTDYEANRGACMACGRCFQYCPQEHDRYRRALDRRASTA